MDDTTIFSGEERPGIVLLLLLLYGFSAIPFSYMASFVTENTATGFGILIVVNMISGMMFSIMVFTFQNSDSENLEAAGDVLRWCFRLLPSFCVTQAFMNMPQTAQLNGFCSDFDDDVLDLICNTMSIPDVKPCCKHICGDDCFKKRSYFAWETPGIGQEVVMLFVDGILYLVLLCLLERGLLYRFSYFVYKVKKYGCRGYEKSSDDDAWQFNPIDSDVFLEQERIHRAVTKGYLQQSPTKDVLLVDGLTKRYWQFVAVRQLSFGVYKGECFGLLGINGAGKTTTFKMLSGDEIITSGDIYVNGLSLKTDRLQFLSMLGYCPQYDAVILFLTGRETLFLIARLRGVTESELPELVDAFLSSFGLINYANRIVRHYSAGNRRKLSTAIAFLGSPPLVLLDEPTTGVDPVARRKLWEIILAAKAVGMSIILTSHSMEECEILCSRLAIMVNGNFSCLGSIQYLKHKYGQGMMVVAKIGNLQTDQLFQVQKDLQLFMQKEFPGSTVKDVHYGLITFHISDSSTPWKRLFSVLEEAQNKFKLEDYSVSQTNLEQVFLSFARNSNRR